MKQIHHDSPTGAASRAELVRLTSTGLMLADPRLDIRDYKVVDRHEDEIGHVSSLFIDETERKVRMIEIRAGGFFGIGERHVLIPVDAITRVEKDVVHVNVTRENIANSPPYDPRLVDEPASNWEPYYGYYGLSPYWGAGYMYPTFPSIADERDGNNRSEIPRD